MPETPLESYLPTVRPDAHDAVCALAVAIEAAETGFDCKVTYKMLVYTFSQRWHQWVVAVGVSKAAVNLRFLYGSELDDHAGILREGTSTASQADFTTEEVIDSQLVSAYVREAVAKHPNKPQGRPIRAR